jgi:hypothetical protein
MLGSPKPWHLLPHYGWKALDESLASGWFYDVLTYGGEVIEY